MSKSPKFDFIETREGTQTYGRSVTIDTGGSDSFQADWSICSCAEVMLASHGDVLRSMIMSAQTRKKTKPNLLSEPSPSFDTTGLTS